MPHNSHNIAGRDSDIDYVEIWKNMPEYMKDQLPSYVRKEIELGNTNIFANLPSYFFLPRFYGHGSTCSCQ